MKHIVKGIEPQAFEAWKGLASEDWHPDYAGLSGPAKKAVKTALMVEQGWICCYCERRLTDKDSHIEHFQPQSDPAVDPLDFSNMLCSCQNHVKKGEPRHCGNLKGNWFDEDLLVSPVDASCEGRFSFAGNGHVQAADSNDTAAIMTIQRLGLNISKLIALRANALSPFLDDSLTQDEFERFVHGYLQLNSSGMYGEFWTTIRSVFQ
ncbi:retron system putative HNH endonuclease [Desulfoluna sp.]|uniref:retron system putative HNH endonuclease n=1 Tax=Desulfoluna sp. TaxID=2045199 RepID=UPI0026024227|nr:retron system putative HNH endonuclease [Desulfoluna sp.]